MAHGFVQHRFDTFYKRCLYPQKLTRYKKLEMQHAKSTTSGAKGFLNIALTRYMFLLYFFSPELRDYYYLIYLYM